MDESGFIKRRLKISFKNCIAIKNCSILPIFIDDFDSNHISIVAGLTLNGVSFKLLLISTTLNPPVEVHLAPIFPGLKPQKGI